jgi:hypothetical protein
MMMKKVITTSELCRVYHAGKTKGKGRENGELTPKQKMEGEKQESEKRWSVAVAEAEELMSSYNAMLGGSGSAEGPVVVSAVQAQKMLHSAQQLLEPFLAPSASASVDEEGQKQVRELLMRAYEKEAVLLRQLSKSSEGNLHNRFLFIHQSSVVFEKVLAYVFFFFFFLLSVNHKASPSLVCHTQNRRGAGGGSQLPGRQLHQHGLHDQALARPGPILSEVSYCTHARTHNNAHDTH